MKIKENGQYKTIQFKSLTIGNVFVFKKNIYMVCEECSDICYDPCNAVNLKTGEVTYFNSEKFVLYYPNAILNLDIL